MSEIIGYIITAFSPINLLFALMGTVVGITVGALPGFTPTMGIAVLIPITYSMDPTTALVFLGAIYCGTPAPAACPGPAPARWSGWARGPSCPFQIS